MTLAEKPVVNISCFQWGNRAGEVMKCYNSTKETGNEFGEYFGSFCHADIDMSWFGFDYHWHVFVARKNT